MEKSISENTPVSEWLGMGGTDTAATNTCVVAVLVSGGKRQAEKHLLKKGDDLAAIHYNEFT